MKSIKIIATKDISGFFPKKAGEVVKKINGENVTKIEVEKGLIRIGFANGLHEVYLTDEIKMEVEA